MENPQALRVRLRQQQMVTVDARSSSESARTLVVTRRDLGRVSEEELVCHYGGGDFGPSLWWQRVGLPSLVLLPPLEEARELLLGDGLQRVRLACEQLPGAPAREEVALACIGSPCLDLLAAELQRPGGGRGGRTGGRPPFPRNNDPRTQQNHCSQPGQLQQKGSEGGGGGQWGHPCCAPPAAPRT